MTVQQTTATHLMTPGLVNMGHSSIQVTYDRYGHLIDRRETDGAEIARLEHKLLG